MNKAKIDRDIPIAYAALKETGIVEQDPKADNRDAINPSFRGQIATFGAAVSMGSLLSAIAFFSEKDKSAVERYKLLDAILYILHAHEPDTRYDSLYQYAAEHDGHTKPDCREDVLNAAIALKLAINLYPKRKNESDKQEQTP